MAHRAHTCTASSNTRSYHPTPRSNCVLLQYCSSCVDWTIWVLPSIGARLKLGASRSDDRASSCRRRDCSGRQIAALALTSNDLPSTSEPRPACPTRPRSNSRRCIGLKVSRWWCRTIMLACLLWENNAADIACCSALLPTTPAATMQRLSHLHESSKCWL